jgi:hypothetical protein
MGFNSGPKGLSCKMCVGRRNVCGWIAQRSHSTSPSYCDNCWFNFSSNLYLKIPLLCSHHLRPCLQLFHSRWLKSSNLFLLLFMFVFPLLTLFRILLFPFHRSLLSLTRYFIHLPCIHVCPFRLLFTLPFKNFLTVDRKQIPIKI